MDRFPTEIAGETAADATSRDALIAVGRNAKRQRETCGRGANFATRRNAATTVDRAPGLGVQS